VNSSETAIFALEKQQKHCVMKHIIILIHVIAIALVCTDIKAQSLVYQPYIPPQSSGSYSPGYPSAGTGSSRSRVSAERIRTSAYCLYSDGSVSKLRIEVEVYGGSARVVGYYQAPQALVYNSTGRWLQLQPQALVNKCYPDLSGHPLEQEFMYKANIQGMMFYFDL